MNRNGLILKLSIGSFFLMMSERTGIMSKIYIIKMNKSDAFAYLQVVLIIT
jgi:hypothetical protein